MQSPENILFKEKAIEVRNKAVCLGGEGIVLIKRDADSLTTAQWKEKPTETI